MTRVEPSSAFADIPVVDLGQGNRINLGVAAMVGRLPKVAEALSALNAAIKSGTLPPRLLELVRLRIAFHNQCRSCMAVRYTFGIEDGLTEGLVCSLERPEEADDLTGAERAAIGYADLMATNHHAVDDETFARLREHFDDAEIMELCFNVAYYVGFGRMAMALDMTEDLPDGYREEGTIVPWRQDEVIAVSSWSSAR